MSNDMFYGLPKTPRNIEKNVWEKLANKLGWRKPKNDELPTNLSGMVFGMPPGTHISDGMVINSMPRATIIPCEPVFDKGASLFSLDQGKGWTEYTKILNHVGFTMEGSNSIEVAYMADSFPTDTFSNEYGETMFDRMASGVSTSIGDMSQILGLTNTKDIKNMASKIPMFGGAAASGMDKAGKMYGDFTNSLRESGHHRGAQIADAVGNSLAAAATGARIDFPMVWKNSSYTPSYSMTIKLYNPDPTSAASTKQHIVGPIAALLSMALPKVGGKKVASYKWPLFCKVRSPGIFNLNAGFISNVTVIKGGDQHNIGYNQSLAMCDVRLEFGSLYNSIIAGEGSERYKDIRPTLADYLEILGGKSFSDLNQRKDIFYGDISPANLYDTSKSSNAKATERDRNDSIPSRIGSYFSEVYDALKSS